MSAHARLVIGIDVGGTKARAGLVGPDFEVLAHAQRPTAGIAEGELAPLLCALVDELRAGTDAEVGAIGLGIPALLDRSGRVQRAPNLPVREGTSLGAPLAAHAGLPVASENDANCAAIAEHEIGAGRGHDHLVLLTIGTGVGGGVIVDGEPLRGGHGMAAELGHVTIDAEGRPCIGDCPGRGCLEAEASGSALERVARETAEANPGSPMHQDLLAGRLDGPRVSELAADGDPLAIGAFEHIGRQLGKGMASIANVFDPEVILVGGGVSAAGELLIGPAREELRARAMPPIVERLEVRRAQFGGEAGLLGAAIVAQRVADGRPGRAAVERP